MEFSFLFPFYYLSFSYFLFSYVDSSISFLIFGLNKRENSVTSYDISEEWCYTVICQVYLSRKYIPVVILSFQHLLYKPVFYSGHLSCNTSTWRWCNYLDIPSSIIGVLLFNSVFRSRIILLSVFYHGNLYLGQQRLYNWNPEHLLYYILVYKTSSYSVIH